jgi:hypothetical protein
MEGVSHLLMRSNPTSPAELQPLADLADCKENFRILTSTGRHPKPMEAWRVSRKRATYIHG